MFRLGCEEMNDSRDKYGLKADEREPRVKKHAWRLGDSEEDVRQSGGGTVGDPGAPARGVMDPIQATPSVSYVRVPSFCSTAPVNTILHITRD